MECDTDLQKLYRNLMFPKTPTIYSQDVKAMKDAADTIKQLQQEIDCLRNRNLLTPDGDRR